MHGFRKIQLNWKKESLFRFLNGPSKSWLKFDQVGKILNLIGTRGQNFRSIFKCLLKAVFQTSNYNLRRRSSNYHKIYRHSIAANIEFVPMSLHLSTLLTLFSGISISFFKLYASRCPLKLAFRFFAAARLDKLGSVLGQICLLQGTLIALRPRS